MVASFAWALAGTVVATAAWALLSAWLDVLTKGEIGWAVTAFVAGLYYGGFVALIALPGHWVLLLAYWVLLKRWPGLERTRLRFASTTLCLALPIAGVVFMSFLSPWSPFGPSWSDAIPGGVLTLCSAWTGLVAPRLTFRPLRPAFGVAT